MLNNIQKIYLSQQIPDFIYNIINSINNLRKRSSTGGFLISNIRDYLDTSKPSRLALLSLQPEDWVIGSKQYPNIKKFNTTGLTFEIIKTLNEKGFTVDIVDYRIKGFKPDRNYDLYIGHGGNCKSIIESLSKDTLIIHYASGAYWREFNRMSQERYDQFSVRKRIKRIDSFKRSMDEIIEGEDYLAKKADVTFSPGPRTSKTYEGISKNMHLLYLGAYVDGKMIPLNKNFDKGRRNFIYVAGTGGNIQKGLDLLIEAFAKTPELNLYIFCKVENELLKVYKKELKLQNIHYIYQYRFRSFRKKLEKVLNETNFTISAAIDTGPGTAFVGSLGLGLIPVGYVDIEGKEDDSCLAKQFTVDELISNIKTVSSKTVQWYANASRLNILKYKEKHDPESFAKNFSRFLDSVMIKNMN